MRPHRRGGHASRPRRRTPRPGAIPVSP